MNKRSTQRARRGRSGIEMKSLGRLVRYLARYPRQAALPYLFLVVASLSQLAVPRMVRNIIDAVTSGVIAQSALANLARVPAAILPMALPKILAALGLPAGWTLDQLMAEMTQRHTAAPAALLTAALSILGFAALRGVFSFLQVYWAERNSQNVAFDMRNDLFAKIQRLSFSYHDRNQTGQLMIRATDDVEKVRMFIGQGVLQLVSAVVLLVGTLIILFTTNLRLAFVVLPILPVAMIMFMRLWHGLSQPLFSRVQARISALNTILQENLAGIQRGQGFYARGEEQAKFEGQAGSLMNQADRRGAPVHLPVPAGLLDRQPGPGRHSLLRRAADYRRHADPGRMAGVQPVPDVPVLPHGHVRHDHHPDGPGGRLGRIVFLRSWTRKSDVRRRARCASAPGGAGPRAIRAM